MVTLQTADNALKSFYLDAVTDALNLKANPLLAQFQRTNANVVGKDVKKAMRCGISGGIGAGTETGDLPSSSDGTYIQLTAGLKNLYGTIEISDKAIRASASNEGAFVNLLNDEMQSLIKGASFNFGRMLFGDGTGKIAKVQSVESNKVVLNSVAGIVEGMKISFCDGVGSYCIDATDRKVIGVDRVNKTISFDGTAITIATVPVGSYVCINGSAGNELTGLGAIFSEKAIYGVERTHSAMRPYMRKEVGEISESILQTAMDAIEEQAGEKVNFIVCSWGVRRALMEYYKGQQIALPTMELDGGFKAISYNGVPVVADRFCPEGTMYLLNTNDFKIHQLCDWQWLEGEDGKILKQVPGKPVYTYAVFRSKRFGSC